MSVQDASADPHAALARNPLPRRGEGKNPTSSSPRPFAGEGPGVRGRHPIRKAQFRPLCCVPTASSGFACTCVYPAGISNRLDGRLPLEYDVTWTVMSIKDPGVDAPGGGVAVAAPVWPDWPLSAVSSCFFLRPKSLPPIAFPMATWGIIRSVGFT